MKLKRKKIVALVAKRDQLIAEAQQFTNEPPCNICLAIVSADVTLSKLDYEISDQAASAHAFQELASKEKLLRLAASDGKAPESLIKVMATLILKELDS